MIKRILLIAAVLFLLSLLVPAQEKSQPAGNSAQPAETAPVSADQPAHTEKAEGKQEAAGKEEKEDAEEGLKHSAMVKKFGGWIGVSDPNKAYWIFVLLNFAVVAFAIGKGVKSALPGTFRDRTAAIQKGLEQARKASAESSARLADIETRLGRLGTEIQSMAETAEQQGRAEEERLRAATEEERKKIIESAEQEIAAAATVARRDLKAYAAELAINLAQKKIAISESADKALVREFSEHLGSNGRKGGA